MKIHVPLPEKEGKIDQFLEVHIHCTCIFYKFFACLIAEEFRTTLVFRFYTYTITMYLRVHTSYVIDVGKKKDKRWNKERQRKYER